ncbi:AaceriAEL222Cp [[Ashbya] aceris (nom. inval.)]|nr:AaceriAEL222Cp [[Ashbya] aceris (nom. inval.)]
MESNRGSAEAKASLEELEKKGLLGAAGVVVPDMAGVGGGVQQGMAAMPVSVRAQYQQAMQEGAGAGAGSGGGGSSQPPLIQLPSMTMPSLMYQLSHHPTHHGSMPQIPVLKQHQQGQQEMGSGSSAGSTANGSAGLPLLSTTTSTQGIQAIQLNEGEHINSQGQLIGRSGKPLRNTKRAAQNRSAQKAFRQRREKYIKDLEIKAKQYDKLEQEVLSLRRENEELKMRLADLEKLT